MKGIYQQFADWVDQQDPDAAFNPYDCTACVGFQFLKACGYPVAACGVHTWLEPGAKLHQLPAKISDAIEWACDQTGFDNPRVTFGALSARLRGEAG